MASTASIGMPVGHKSVLQARACQVCATSKARCTPRPNSTDAKCERCHRLKKECLPGQLVERKPRRLRTSRTAQLEKKLDGLVSLLTASQNSDQSLVPEAALNGSLHKAQVVNPLTTQSFTLDARGWISATAPNVDSISQQSQLQNTHIASNTIESSIWTSFADRQLHMFQTKMSPYFPFIVIPPGTTAGELRASNPFLYENIMMVTAYSELSRQARLHSEIVKFFAEQTLLQSKRSLDLLQGILIFIAWYHHQLWASRQLTNMVQLAVALVLDLRLNRPQNAFDRDVFMDAIQSLPDKPPKPARTLAERRAFLGLVCLSRALSGSVGKTEPLQNTPYVEECCNELEKRQEYQSDKDLVLQVRLQNLADVPIHSFPSHNVDYWSESGAETICMLVKSFEGSLEQFKNAMGPEFTQKWFFRLRLLSISIHNNEIAFRRHPSTDYSNSTSNPQRIALLMNCLQSTKEFFTEWFLLPTNIYHHVPMNVCALLAHATIVLGVLNFFQYPGWDLEHVREIAPFGSTMDALAQKYEAASCETDDSGASRCSTFGRRGKNMKALIAWFEARKTGNSRQGGEYSHNLETLANAAAGEVGNTLDGDMLDERVWNEIMAWAINDLSY